MAGTADISLSGCAVPLLLVGALASSGFCKNLIAAALIGQSVEENPSPMDHRCYRFHRIGNIGALASYQGSQNPENPDPGYRRNDREKTRPDRQTPISGLRIREPFY